jgi:hypothetical protein
VLDFVDARVFVPNDDLNNNRQRIFDSIGYMNSAFAFTREQINIRRGARIAEHDETLCKMNLDSRLLDVIKTKLKCLRMLSVSNAANGCVTLPKNLHAKQTVSACVCRRNVMMQFTVTDRSSQTISKSFASRPHRM